MKIYHFTIVFAVFAAMMLMVMNTIVNEYSYKRTDTAFLDEACDRAADAGASILSRAGNTGVYGVREAAVNAFYESLAASLSIAGYAGSRANLRMYIPLIIVAYRDAVYVCYDNYVPDDSGAASLVRQWSENLIGRDVEEILQYYCDIHNTVATRAGIRYEFTLPKDDGGMFLRGNEGTGFYVMMQGYPIQGTASDTYNRFSFAGTGLDISEKYYINLTGNGYSSPLYFHRENCMYRAGESTVYTERRDCALAGAYECPKCGGDGY